MMLNVPAPTRVPLGTLDVGGKKIELFLSQEWARYFQSLNSEVQASTAALAQSAALTPFLGDASDSPDQFPGPPGPRGQEGAPGLALFMLQDDPHDEPLMVPPTVDGVFVPLNSKDASSGVPGLTQFKLNLKNLAGTIVSFLTNANTAARTYTLQDRDGTIADDKDLALKAPIASPTFTGDVFFKGASTLANAAAFVHVTDGATDVYASSSSGVAKTLNFHANGGAGATLSLDASKATVTGAASVSGAFGCNGKAPQAAAASGGTLAGVIAALVANGILSS